MDSEMVKFNLNVDDNIDYKNDRYFFRVIIRL